MNPILPARLDWPSAIGNFILNFGMLDWHVFALLEARMPPDKFAEIKDEYFQNRIKRVQTLVNDGDYSKFHDTNPSIHQCIKSINP